MRPFRVLVDILRMGSGITIYRVAVVPAESFGSALMIVHRDFDNFEIHARQIGLTDIDIETVRTTKAGLREFTVQLEPKAARQLSTKGHPSKRSEAPDSV